MFERVYVINLPRRVDRLIAFQRRLERYGWPFKEPIVYRAIEGDKVGVPPEFTQGGGAYGCRMSHLRILQDCLMDDVQSVLILEDDADITEGFPERVTEFLKKVPDDWEGIMLGGQHHAPPRDIGIPGVVRVRYCQRTHAYAARPSYMKALQRRWGNATVHIDWLMRDWQHQFIVYAPDPWLIGQAGGRSDIRGDEKPIEWWAKSKPPVRLPVIVLRAPVHVIRELIKRGLHAGWNRNPDTEIDSGLEPVAAMHSPETRSKMLWKWLDMIESECVGGLVPCVTHPRISVDEVKQVWSGEVFLAQGETVREAWVSIPARIRRALEDNLSLRRAPIVLLRCPRDMIEQLPATGFHPGYWRDPKTGLDRGLMRIMEMENERAMMSELMAWCDLLCREADRDGLIVTAIHPKLRLEMLKLVTDREVLEVAANTCEELRRAIFGHGS